MGTVNSGGQFLTFSFQEPLTSPNFNKAFTNIIKPGIYSPLTSGLCTLNTVSIFTLNPFTAWLNCTNGGSISVTTSLGISFPSGVTPSLTISSATPVLYMSYTHDITQNKYLDFGFCAVGALPANAILVATLTFSGSAINGFDYTNTTLGTINPTGDLVTTTTLRAPQAVLNIAQGTAPLVVSSNTKVTDLNSDMVDGVHVDPLTNTQLMRYNSVTNSIENATVTEISGALAGVTSLGMSGALTSSNTTASTTKDTGAIVTEGGIGVEGRINAGGAIASSSTITGTQLVSTIAGGTAPLAVTSSTVVPNLNASQLQGKVIGITGNTIPLLDGTNTWTGTNNTFNNTITGSITGNASTVEGVHLSSIYNNSEAYNTGKTAKVINGISLNDITSTGFYFGVNCTSTPGVVALSYFSLIHSSYSANLAIQTLTVFSSVNRTYSRYNNNGWGTWKLVAWAGTGLNTTLSTGFVASTLLGYMVNDGDYLPVSGWVASSVCGGAIRVNSTTVTMVFNTGNQNWTTSDTGTHLFGITW